MSYPALKMMGSLGRYLHLLEDLGLRRYGFLTWSYQYLCLQLPYLNPGCPSYYIIP